MNNWIILANNHAKKIYKNSVVKLKIKNMITKKIDFFIIIFKKKYKEIW